MNEDAARLTAEKPDAQPVCAACGHTIKSEHDLWCNEDGSIEHDSYSICLAHLLADLSAARTKSTQLSDALATDIMRMAVVKAENERPYRRIARLERALRAIDVRLHDVARHEVLFAPAGPQHVMAVPVQDFRQICRVIVAATAMHSCTK